MMANPNCTPSGTTVSLTANATDPDGDTLLYTWTTTGGRVTGDGPNVTWDLSGVAPGTYTANVEVDDGCGCISYSSTTVTVDRCDCMPTPVPPTPVPPTPPSRHPPRHRLTPRPEACSTTSEKFARRVRSPCEGAAPGAH
jgi:hypothetical protein